MHRTTIHAHTHALIDDKHTCPVICKLTCKWYDTHTHNHTHRCWCETNTHSRSRTCLGRATPSRQLMDVKQKWRGEKWNKPSRRGDHRVGARPREKEENQPGESVLGKIKQCFLYQQWKGPAWETEQAGNLRPRAPHPPPCLRLPFSLFFRPPRCLSSHPSHLLYLPTKGHTRTLFPFL